MSETRDKGAHFYRCDFQVHTPRDAQWHGEPATSPAERKAYAEELIRACRSKEIDAIAVTDHHDFAFFPYIKAAAKNEVDSDGVSIPKERQIVVFPGVELTLSSPACQALLLLDADFDEGKLNDILTALSLDATQENASKLPSVDSVSPTSVTSLNDLEEKLSLRKWLKGRFILLPHVSDRGHKTIFREGFEKHYKEMRCVGGYVEGEYSTKVVSRRSIVEGKQQDYGYPGIGVFQTSDNRKRDHSDLGEPITWVKWSEPTAEALRQACLARESRLSHTEPQLPGLWIASMAVSNSKFLGRLDVDFSQQYNVVIGGRGTGKSTMLEYLRWGLCDQPVESADSDLAPVQTKRKKLIDDTLQKVDGEVVVTFYLNGVRHIVRRSCKTHEIQMRIGTGELAHTTEQEVRNLFGIQAYSQKQLSSVGVRVEELKRLIETPIKHSLDQVRSNIRATEVKIRNAYGNLVRKREIEADIAKYDVEITSSTLQAEVLRESLKGLSADDQETIRRKTLYDNEELVVADLRNELARLKDRVDSLCSEIGDSSQEIEAGSSPASTEDHDDLGPQIQNAELIEAIRASYEAHFARARAAIGELASLFDKGRIAELERVTEVWNKAKDAFNLEYESAKIRATANQQQLEQIAVIERRLTELRRLQAANRNALTALGDADNLYSAQRKRWDEIHNEKLRQLDNQCKGFSALSNGLIKADIAGGLDAEGLRRKFKVLFAGLNIKEQKIEDLCKYVVCASDPMAAWNIILAELEELALHNLSPTAPPLPLPRTPTIDECKFLDTEKTRIVGGFDASKWLELSLTELEFNPVFRYCTNKETGDFIDFADASAGQQATALLTVLLNQKGLPLIIDQPEDDIDSKMSPEIVRQIWKAKSSRQLIFASHNANFVVNGDAELVICCDYVRSADQTGGRIKDSGAIDNRAIRDEITVVTEGGKDAFKLRKEKYGF